MPESVQRACPVCGEVSAKEFMRKKGLRLVRCLRCAMIYTNPVDAGLVSGAFYEALAEGFYLAPDKVEADYAAVRFARELRLLRRFCARGRILDVGCSNGAFLFQLGQHFPGDYGILGVDVAGPALDYAASRGVPVRRGAFLEMDFEQRFSAVTFWATLEHIVDPAPFLARAAAVLEPGGHCFALAPNFRSLAVRLLGAKYRYILPQHVNYFTAETLRALAGRERTFEIAAVGSTHFNPAVIWQDWRRRGPVSDADRVELLKRTTALKRNPMLGPLKLALAVAEKALGAVFLADNLTMVLRRRSDG